jgi:hypothetical protein
MAEGHPNARHYSIAVLMTETEIARKRVQGRMVSEVGLIRAAIPAAIDKAASRAFTKLLEELNADAE